MNVRRLKKHLGNRFEVVRGKKRQIEVLTKDGNRPVAFRPDGSWTDEKGCAEYLRSKMPVATIGPRPI